VHYDAREKLAVAHSSSRASRRCDRGGISGGNPKVTGPPCTQIACDVGGAHGPEILRLARANERTSTAAGQHGAGGNARIHIVLATSDLP